VLQQEGAAYKEQTDAADMTASVQWSFRKTGTMGTLASQAENRCLGSSTGGGRFHRFRGHHPQKNFETVYAKSYNLVHFGRKVIRNAVRNEFVNTSTMGMAFPSK